MSKRTRGMRGRRTNDIKPKVAFSNKEIIPSSNFGSRDKSRQPLVGGKTQQEPILWCWTRCYIGTPQNSTSSWLNIRANPCLHIWLSLHPSHLFTEVAQALGPLNNRMFQPGGIATHIGKVGGIGWPESVRPAVPAPAGHRIHF